MSTTREPLFTNGSIIGIATAVLALVVAFGLELTQDQQVAILGVVAAVVPLVLVLVTRGKVTPVADPRLNDGRVLVPVVPYRDQGSDYHDRGGALTVVLIILAVIGLLALLGYGIGA